jgi:hypothetical protein
MATAAQAHVTIVQESFAPQAAGINGGGGGGGSVTLKASRRPSRVGHRRDLAGPPGNPAARTSTAAAPTRTAAPQASRWRHRCSASVIRVSGSTAASARSRRVSSLASGQAHFDTATTPVGGSEIRARVKALTEPQTCALMLASLGARDCPTPATALTPAPRQAAQRASSSASRCAAAKSSAPL